MISKDACNSLAGFVLEQRDESVGQPPYRLLGLDEHPLISRRWYDRTVLASGDVLTDPADSLHVPDRLSTSVDHRIGGVDGWGRIVDVKSADSRVNDPRIHQPSLSPALIPTAGVEFIPEHKSGEHESGSGAHPSDPFGDIPPASGSNHSCSVAAGWPIHGGCGSLRRDLSGRWSSPSCRSGLPARRSQ